VFTRRLLRIATTGIESGSPMARAKRLLRTVKRDDYDEADNPFAVSLQYERPAGTGSIVLKTIKGIEYYRGRVWTVDDTGVRRARDVYGKTYSEAERKMRAAQKAQSNEISATTTVAAFMRGWLVRIKTENRIGTWRLYESTFRNHIEPSIGKVKFKALTAQNVRALLVKLSENGVKDRPRQNVRKILHGAYQAALRDGLIGRNPVATVASPKAESHEQRILTQDEAKKLLDAAQKTRWYPLIRLAIQSGMREGELFALTVADLHLDDKHPHLLVNATLTRAEEGALVRTEPKTKASRRRVDIDPDTAKVLRGIAQGLDAPEHVFTTPNGSIIRKDNFLRREFYPMLDAAKLPRVTFHSLRHIVNTLLLATGAASHLDLAARLGHTTPRMTLERYARVVPGAQAGIAIIAGDLLKTKGVKPGVTRPKRSIPRSKRA